MLILGDKFDNGEVCEPASDSFAAQLGREVLSMVNDIRRHDIVLIKKGKYAGMYGCVLKVSSRKALVYVFDAGSDGNPDSDDVMRNYALSSLSYVPPISLSAEEMRSLARFEASAIEQVKAHQKERYSANASCQLTLDDLEIALQNIISSSNEDNEVAMTWYRIVFEELENAYGIWDYIDGKVEPEAGSGKESKASSGKQLEAESAEENIPGITSARNVFADVQGSLSKRYALGSKNETPLPELLDDIRKYKRNRSKPLVEREYTQEELERFLRNWDNDRVALFGTPDITAMYVRAVNELADANLPIGLHEKAYACYGKGNAGFDEDWATSRDCLLKLEEIDPKSMYANTLGYIYYYGRCNGGKPEYEKAFYWFSIGAAGGVYESRYKIADMIKDGKGCHKDHEIASHVIWDLYNENLEHFCRGTGHSKFADVALRMGNLFRDGVDCHTSFDDAYRYYLMAKLAIRLRRQCCDMYGDESVEKAIDEAIQNVLPKTSFKKKANVVNVDLCTLLRFAVGYGRRVRMDYRQLSITKYRLTFRMEDRADRRYASKIPVLLPEAQFCGLLEELVVTADKAEMPHVFGKSGSIVFDEICDKFPGYGGLMLFGDWQVKIVGTFTVDCRNLVGENRRYVSVSFEDPDNCWDYLCDDEAVVIGSKVRVPYREIVREGIVKRVTERFDCEVELHKNAYKQVIELL